LGNLEAISQTVSGKGTTFRGAKKLTDPSGTVEERRFSAA